MDHMNTFRVPPCILQELLVRSENSPPKRERLAPFCTSSQRQACTKTSHLLHTSPYFVCTMRLLYTRQRKVL